MRTNAQDERDIIMAIKKLMKPVASVRPQAPIRPQAPVATARPAAPAVAAAPIAVGGQTLVQKRGPGRPSNAELAARAAAGGATVAVNNGAASAPRAVSPPVDLASIMATVEGMKETIQQQTATIAKLKEKPSNVRSLSDITDGAENGIAPDDW